VETRIQLHLGPALQTLDKLAQEGQGGTFDFAFIDADKENLQAYFEYALVMVRHGGAIAVNDVLGKDDSGAMRDFNERLRDDHRVMISTLPMGDGLTLAMKL
jgi:caffeoyl-CoA O-methyltransferase